jgi:glycine cleavage system H protein
MKILDNLKYTKDHEWIAVDGDIATVGITDFAQGELGELVYIEVETIGETLDREEVFGTVEAVKTTAELYMPVSGEVLEFNSELSESEGDNPGLINEDPYGNGWIVRVKITRPEELEDLLSAEDYKNLVS